MQSSTMHHCIEPKAAEPSQQAFDVTQWTSQAARLAHIEMQIVTQCLPWHLCEILCSLTNHRHEAESALLLEAQDSAD